MIVECCVCGKKKHIVPAKYKKVMESTGKFFCSREHYWVWRKGEGKKYFSSVFKKLAQNGNTKAANESVKGFEPWNKGLTSATDERVAKSAKKRVESYGGKEGLSRHARELMKKHKHGFYTGARSALPRQQRVVLEMVEAFIGRGRVAWEYFMLIGDDQPIFVDIVVVEKMLAIEVDGKVHKLKTQINQDVIRDQHLTSIGWKVLRLTNDLVDSSLESVEKMIKEALDGD